MDLALKRRNTNSTTNHVAKVNSPNINSKAQSLLSLLTHCSRLHIDVSVSVELFPSVEGSSVFSNLFHGATPRKKYNDRDRKQC